MEDLLPSIQDGGYIESDVSFRAAWLQTSTYVQGAWITPFCPSDVVRIGTDDLVIPDLWVTMAYRILGFSWTKAR